MCDKLRIKKITDNIILLNMDTQKEISELLIRFQEYYESPLPEIKNNIFTLGRLKQLYGQSSRTNTGAFTYHSGNLFTGDWNGFNFPGYVIEPFAKGLFDPLTPGEQDVVELFRYRDDKFYIIGTHNEDGENWALEHEIMHGLFYIYPKYKEKVISIIEKYSKNGFTFNAFKKFLLSWGYDESVIIDEIHAYIGADYEWLIKDKADKLSQHNINIPEDMYKELQKVKKKFFKPVED